MQVCSIPKGGDFCSMVRMMSMHWVFNDCDQGVKAEIEAYWAKKWPRLKKLLTPYPEDQQDVRMSVHQRRHDPQTTWYDIRAVIHLPTGTLVAEASERNPRAALDKAA